MHSGSFGGATPDALAALLRMLASLWDAQGNAVLDLPGLESGWAGQGPSDERFRVDAGVLDGVDLVGEGPIGERIWARPSITVLGIDCPTVAGSLPAIQGEARARVSLRVPPGMASKRAEETLIAQLRAATPWNARVEIYTQKITEPLAGVTTGVAYTAFREALRDAYHREPVALGQGGTIPVCSAFATSYPGAELILFGVEEPLCAIHSPNESVDPGEIERIALAETLFLRRYCK